MRLAEGQRAGDGRGGVIETVTGGATGPALWAVQGAACPQAAQLVRIAGVPAQVREQGQIGAAGIETVARQVSVVQRSEPRAVAGTAGTPQDRLVVQGDRDRQRARRRRCGMDQLAVQGEQGFRVRRDVRWRPGQAVAGDRQKPAFDQLDADASDMPAPPCRWQAAGHDDMQPLPGNAELGIAGQRGQQLQGPGEGTAPCHDVIEIQAHQGQAAQVEVWPQNQANPVTPSSTQQVQGITARQVPAAVQGVDRIQPPGPAAGHLAPASGRAPAPFIRQVGAQGPKGVRPARFQLRHLAWRHSRLRRGGIGNGTGVQGSPRATSCAAPRT
ncbi:hypothetical protein QR90_12785 [Deinococcus radiopugnans]|uniref:Uncharacterized protein n=1 Tax=Deinococcus radiopugnans TaxID=57497 RepID=A0A0A7KHV6_9DEIO|nr:hypothetical protein QR90_12785 [Deinococcus radiopugnans]